MSYSRNFFDLASLEAETMDRNLLEIEDRGSGLIDYCKTDSLKWAAMFRQTAIRLGYSDMPLDWLFGWFANAMMTEHYAVEALEDENRSLSGVV